MEKIADLYEGTAVYRVHIDELRERDVNARVMSKNMFDRLISNMKIDKRLESLPLCAKSKDRENELMIISGHHRTRAARAAGIHHLFVIAIEDELSEDEIKSKQLSHNSLNGFDDEQMLKSIYDSIQDLDSRLKSGVFMEDDLKFNTVGVKEVNLEFEFEIVNMMFLHTQLQKFDRALALIQDSKDVRVVDLANFEQFKKAVKSVSGHDNVRNISAIMNRMSEIVIEYYAKKDKDDEEA